MFNKKIDKNFHTKVSYQKKKKTPTDTKRKNKFWFIQIHKHFEEKS